MLQNKNCMLKRGPYKGVEVPCIINDVYINEHDDGYLFDIKNSNDVRKIRSDKEIRVTFDTWNVYKPSADSYVDISGLFATFVYRKIIYNCSLLLNISMSITIPSESLTGSVSHIGKIREFIAIRMENICFLSHIHEPNMI